MKDFYIIDTEGGYKVAQPEFTRIESGFAGFARAYRDRGLVASTCKLPK